MLDNTKHLHQKVVLAAAAAVAVAVAVAVVVVVVDDDDQLVELLIEAEFVVLFEPK